MSGIPRYRRRRPTVSILDACDDPALFASHFRDARTWTAWRAFLATLFGLPLDTAQQRIFHDCTGREHAAPNGYQEAWLVIGRRGGKSFVLALIAVYLACFRTWTTFLGPGEVGTVMVVAADRKQARVILRYVKGLLRAAEMLARLIVSETAESITLSNRLTIEVHTASFRTTRGYTIVAALLDELAFWAGEDSAEPDTEVLAAIKPGMATIPGAMLLCASSPYARRGALWEAHKRHYGHDSDVLVWQAPTLTMHDTATLRRVVAQATDDDPTSAAAEYGAQFRSDIQAFVRREAVEACVATEVYERAPLPDVMYHAFVDPSGGSNDSMTLAVGHRGHDGAAILDCVREVIPPFSPESVVQEFAQVLKSYRIASVTGDRYAGEWAREPFRKLTIEYELADKPKSAIYVDALPLLNSRRVDLLDHPKLINQLCALERRTARGGRDSIDHPPNQHDDVANAVAGVAVKLAADAITYDHSMAWVGDIPTTGGELPPFDNGWTRHLYWSGFLLGQR